MPHTSKVLTLSLSLDSLKLGLEIQSISHLVEEESQEEVTPVAVESEESSVLNLVEGVREGIAVGQRICNGSINDTSQVEVWFKVVRLLARFEQGGMLGDVVGEVSALVETVDDIVEARVSVFIGVGKLGTNDEGVEL